MGKLVPGMSRPFAHGQLYGGGVVDERIVRPVGELVDLDEVVISEEQLFH